ncbi:MAG: hypothetical protein LBD94_02340 [Rickettsiales bacterium]|nr:hypothetical protein [Rickettsiales bacterium]
MIARFVVLREEFCGKHIVVAGGIGELHDKIKEMGVTPELFVTCGSYDTKTRIMRRTHSELLSDKYIEKLVLSQLNMNRFHLVNAVIRSFIRRCSGYNAK